RRPARRPAPPAAWRCSGRRRRPDPRSGPTRRRGRRRARRPPAPNRRRARGARWRPPPGAPCRARSLRTSRRPLAARRPAPARRSCRARARSPPATGLSRAASPCSGWQRRPWSTAPSPSWARALDRLALAREQGLHRLPGQRDERAVLLGRESALLGGGLDLDEAAVAGHHEVAVDIGLRVLGVRQVDARLAVDDPGGNGGHRLPDRLLAGRPLARLGQPP